MKKISVFIFLVFSILFTGYIGLFAEQNGAKVIKSLPLGVTFEEKDRKIIVKEILPNSTFAKTSLKVGVIVKKVNNVELKSFLALKKIVENLKKDEQVAIFYQDPKTGKLDVAVGKVGLVGGIIGLNFTIIMQIINFLILMVILYKLLYKPVLELLDKRREQIRNDLETARKEREEAYQLLEKYKKTLEEFQAQKDSLLAKAEQEAEAERQKMLEKAKVEAQSIINNAKLVVEKETAEAISKIKKEMGELILDVSRKVIQEVVDDQLDKKLREKVLEKVET